MAGKKAHPIKRDWYWNHNDRFEIWHSLDWPSVRRGRQIYTEVFAPCHPLGRMTFTHFQGFMTREEIKKLASQYEVIDSEPDAEGMLNPRPGKPTDTLPIPFPNQRAAQFANNGSEPPDLQHSVFGKEGGPDYIFSLITGYNWGNGELLEVPPFAPELKPGQFWNPYFKDCVLSMPPPLSDGMVDYEDGTPATTSQMAKDVVNFLRWSAESEYDDRRVMFWKAFTTLGLVNCILLHYGQKNTNWRIYGRTTFRYWKKTW
ncbi:putative cytochrome c1, heme protein, mitochondrial [Trypanosoma cruzi]|uniref:Putative cytochrome c1, heme protein, mitochondrial n=1 Tax=Trypanosoma cruzi TaxID=5693 RepID=A0A2V2XDC1_TRYCR|nr:putative cytochrome c1, heme protein, mitochondrial [Trypanosoma cruzi]